MYVVWYKGSFGNWDAGLLSSIMEKHPTVFQQVNSPVSPIISDKAMYIIVGKPNPVELRDYLSKCAPGLVVLTSEEDAYYDWKAAIPEHMDVWTQYYHPSTKSEIKERLLLGPPLRIRDYKINKHLPKKYLWSFVGQVQNPFRQQCVDTLKFWGGGFMQIVENFGGIGQGGMEYQQYLDIMCESKYVMCPAGSMCVDSFRVYEAVECGAIPITDVRSPRDPEGFNYWKEVVGHYAPVQIEDWSKIGGLLFDLEGGHSSVDRNGYWWDGYKIELEKKLLRYARN
jgi:hypothetical protein